jgi:hypothetical protein
MKNHENAIFDRVILLVARFNDTFLELASLLRQLQQTDPEWFRQIIAIPQLGRRKAYYLLQIDRAFGQLPVERIRLNQIGWTKLQVIAEHVTAQNYEELIALAEAHTVENLKAIMRGEKPILKGRSVLLHFTRKQFRVFSKAILKHGATKNGPGFIGKEGALTKALRHTKA